MSNVNDFSVAKVGDSVWSFIHGQGIVKKVSPEDNFLIITFDNYDRELAYRLDGRFIKEEFQTLFWAKPEIIAPERPKRLVKKVVKVRPYWISDLKNTFGILVNASNADDVRWCGPEQDVTIEVWEE